MIICLLPKHYNIVAQSVVCCMLHQVLVVSFIICHGRLAVNMNPNKKIFLTGLPWRDCKHDTEHAVVIDACE